MDIESIRDYIYYDTDEEFSLKKIREGLRAVAVIFLLVCVFGLAFKAYLTTAVSVFLFVSYAGWVYIWTRGYFKDTFMQRLFLRGSSSWFVSLVFGSIACIFIDISGSHRVCRKLLLLLVILLCTAMFYSRLVMRIRKKKFSGHKEKRVNWDYFYVPCAAMGYFGARYFLPEADQNTAVEIVILFTSFASMLCIPSTQGLFKYILIKKYHLTDKS